MSEKTVSKPLCVQFILSLSALVAADLNLDRARSLSPVSVDHVTEEGVVDQEGAHHRQQDRPPQAHLGPLALGNGNKDQMSNLEEKLNVYFVPLFDLA